MVIWVDDEQLAVPDRDALDFQGMVIVWLDGDAKEGGDGALSGFVDAVPWDCVPLHRLVPGVLRRLEPVVDVGEFILFVEWWVLHE